MKRWLNWCALFGSFLWAFSDIARAEAPGEVTFLAYNLANFVRMVRTVPGQGRVENAPKPEEEIAALIKIVAAEKPDMIGVCEMGKPEEFRDFLRRLKEAGLDFPYIEHVEAMDEERHLAFASRLPISARNSQTELSFELSGKKQYFKRGILDVVVDVSPTERLHFLGAHLKSRREVSEDQAVLRRNEARLLRLHARAILAKNPDEKLLLYGDLNDTINEAPIRELLGKKGAKDYLKPLDLRDANGEKWTHYWKVADIYSRIDYILASPAAARNVISSKSHIGNPPDWSTASDHRPLVLVIKTASNAAD